MKLEYKEHIIKKNDYVRTINGQLDRIKRIQEGEDYKGSFLEIEHYSGILDLYRCPMISIYPVKYKNNSKNIIDLIEVGDYVNGCLIIEIDKDPFIKGQINLWTNTIKSEGEPFPNDYYKVKIIEKDIKSVVTKEMMKSVEYRIERDMETN